MRSDGEPARPAAPEHRLHPASLVFSIGTAARRLLLPGLLLLVATRGSGVEVWIMLAFIPAVAAATIRFWTFRYRFEPDELIVRQGIVTRNERHVPYSRIQNIDLVQNVLHRLLRVAEVRVETAGGERPEAVMRVLSLDAVEQMRSRVFAGRAAPGRAEDPATAEDGHLLHAMRWRDVLLFGVISNKGMVVVAAALGALWQFEPWERLSRFLTAEQIRRLESLPRPHGAIEIALVAIMALGLILLVMRLLSVAWAFVRFHGFRLWARGDALRAEYGLLTRVTKTIPRHRIQVLSIREGVLHRWSGRTSVLVRTAGSATDEGGGRGSGRLWLAPLIGAGERDSLLREVLPDVPLAGLQWEPVSERARRRIFRQSLVLLLPALAAGVWAIGAWAVLPALPLAALGYANAVLYVRHAGFAVVAGAVIHRSGWWTRTTTVVRFSKIQSVLRVESPFDRRNRMATVRVDTAGSGGGAHAVDAPFLDRAVATALAARLSAEAGRTSFRW